MNVSPSDNSQPLRLVRLLGTVDAVTNDGSVVKLPSKTQRRLVAMLALQAPNTVRADYLGSNLDLGAGALRNTVSRLRKTFGSALHTSPLGYGLDAEVDVQQFERAFRDASERADDYDNDDLVDLDDALALWRGDALAEFQDEPWALADVSRLHELRAAAIDERGLRLIAQRRSAEAVATMETQVAAHPLRDVSRGILLRAPAASGRQADALRAYQRYRSYLVEEVGTEPSSEVRDIERRIAGGWDGRGGDRRSNRAESRSPRVGDAPKIPLPAIFASEGHSRVSDNPRIGHPTVVGRAEELGILDREFAAGAFVRGLRTVIVGGEPGIGKTTLIAKFVHTIHAHGNVTVVAGRCDEHGSVVLEPFRAALTFLVDRLPISLLEQHTAAVGNHVSLLAPNLASRLGRDVPVTTTDDFTGRYLLFEAVSDLFRRVAEFSRLVLVLDDVHWAEPTTLLLIRHLHQALSTADIAVLITHRDSEVDRSTALRSTFATLERGRARRIVLGGLDADAFEDLVTRIVHDSKIAVDEPATPNSDAIAPEFVQKLLVETSGNPLYTVHLVRQLVESKSMSPSAAGLTLSAPFDSIEVPHSIRDVVWSRVSALGDERAQLLVTASVLGREFEPHVLRALADCSDADVFEAIDAGTRAGLLSPSFEPPSARSGEKVRFAHALVAHALYYELTGIRRARLHASAATVLLHDHREHSGDDRRPDLAVALARHFGLADDHHAAAIWSEEAGNNALANFAPHEAARWFEAALDHARALDRSRPSGDVVSSTIAHLTLRLGQAQRRAGMAAARSTLLEAASMAQQTGDADVLIQSAISNARGFQMADEADLERIAMIEAALRTRTNDERQLEVEAELLALLSQELHHTPESERRIEAAEKSLKVARDIDDPALLVRVAPGVLTGLWEPGRAAQRCEIARAALAVVDRVDDPLLRFRLYSTAYSAAVQHADHELARTSWAKTTEVASAFADPSMRRLTQLTGIFEMTMAGELEAAEAAAEMAFAIGGESGESDAFLIYAAHIGAIRALQGRQNELYELVAQGAVANPDNGSLQLYYGCISMDVGKLDVARDVLQKGVERDFAHIPFDFTWATTIASYAILASGLGEVGAAKRLLELTEPFADEICFNGAACLGMMAAQIAPLATLVGRYDDAERYTLKALDVHRSFGWSFHEASALISLARNRVAKVGTIDDDVERWLTDASEIADRQGLVRLQNAIAAIRS